MAEVLPRRVPAASVALEPMRAAPSETSDEARMVAGMRLVLAAAGLAIIVVDPSEPNRFAALTYGVLVLYTGYSGLLYAVSLTRHAEPVWLSAASHWVDVGWYTLLIALSSGTNSVFFFGYYFAVLVAAIRHGRAAGLQVGIVSACLYATVGYATLPADQSFEINRFALRPVFLLVLGYMIAALAGLKTAANRRLTLLHDVSAVSNPRLGADRTLAEVMERLRDFFDAETCLLLTRVPDVTGGYLLRRRGRVERPEEPVTIAAPPDLAHHLLSPAEDLALISMPGPPGRRSRRQRLARDVATGRHVPVPLAVCEKLEATLEPFGFITVPVRYTETIAGRVFVAARRRVFRDSDIDLLEQLFRQLMPVLENIRLIDRLASDAAEAERQRIARDIHDSVIQSYIGLQLGLSGMHQKAAGGHAVLPEIERLQDLLDVEVAEMRQYVTGLRAGAARSGALVGSLQRFTSKFEYATGIGVRLEVDPALAVGSELAAEAFRIVEEALSNVRRHTVSTEATVRLCRRDGHLEVRVEDFGAGPTGAMAFTPRSIAERAAALGGRVVVEPHPDGGSAVVVTLPLQGQLVT